MRINNQPVPGIHKAYEQQKKTVGLNAAGAPNKNDDLEISADAKLWGIAAKALRELPETTGNLAELQRAVASGTYQVNSDDVAEKLWQENGFDKRV